MKTQELKRVTRGAVIAVLVVCFASATVSAEVTLNQKYLTASQTRTTDGEQLYNALCAVCHGQAGRGDGPAVPALRQSPIDLTVLATSNNNEFPREALEETIYGKDRIAAHEMLDMPIWGRAFEYTRPHATRLSRIKFAKRRIGNIVDYIESLQAE